MTAVLKLVPKPSSNVLLPLFSSKVAAGFPSPADDYIESPLDLNEYLIKHPAATFFVRVTGDSMTGVGIFDGDMLIVDRSIEPSNGSVVLAVVNGEFTVKRLRKTSTELALYPENPKHAAIQITAGTEFEVWGIVTNVIHSLK